MTRNSQGNREKKTTAAKISIRPDARLADEAVRTLGAKSRSEAARMALREIVSLKQPKRKRSNWES
jgi:metal-responsive CopG/Arc/MetJ family transcriptional regulator